ncbi:Fc.00g095020.m01.CDS01 [Cosmosporella sp. VM-42]
MSSWLPIPSDSYFSLANIPFGIISSALNTTHRPAIAIGEYVLDLQAFAEGGGFSASEVMEQRASVFSASTLNTFASLGRSFHRLVREYLQAILATDTNLAELLKDNQKLRELAFLPRSELQNHLPLAIGDYTDYYAGENHAYNVGVLFRGPENALQPNYRHLPVAYHGRACSSAVRDTDSAPLGPDPTPWGEDSCFNTLREAGLRARARNEYVPLGPFTAKNLGTSISAWVILADALEKTKQQGIKNNTELLPYLRQESQDNILGIELEVILVSAENGSSTVITRTNSRELVWSWPQMIAHHTITGCNLRTGDLLASGTISGKEEGTQGSLVEQTRNGKNLFAYK